MLGHFSRGIVLEQHKEPALSGTIVEFLNSSGAKQYFTSELERELHKLTPTDILDLARMSEIIDETDGKSLYQKLLEAQGRHYTIVVADAVDDEPYVSSQMCMVLHKPQELQDGIALVMRALSIAKSAVAVYRNLTDLGAKIPPRLGDIPVRRIFGRYPVQERTQDAFAGERVFLVGSNALVHFARALREHRVQTTCFVTVGGDAIHTQQNMEVSRGMSLELVLDRCGVTQALESIVIGGPMSGVSVIDPANTVVTERTRAVLAFRENKKERQYRCIGCGRCVDACPQSLTPFYLYQNIRKGKYGVLRFYDIDRCIECGTCSYICPSKLDVAALIIGAKHQLAKTRAAARTASGEPAREEESNVRTKA